MEWRPEALSTHLVACRVAGGLVVLSFRDGVSRGKPPPRYDDLLTPRHMSGKMGRNGSDGIRRLARSLVGLRSEPFCTICTPRLQGMILNTTRTPRVSTEYASYFFPRRTARATSRHAGSPRRPRRGPPRLLAAAPRVAAPPAVLDILIQLNVRLS